MSDVEDEEIEDVKLILLGESGVGKTSLINVSIGKRFQDNLAITFTCSLVKKDFQRGTKKYSLNIWDTAGQEIYRALNKLFIKDSKIVIFTYSINSLLTFQELTFWVSLVREILGDEPIFGLVGNKSDLYANAEVDQETAKKFAEQIGAKFETVSAKTNPKAFVNFLDTLLDEYLAKKGNKENEEDDEEKEKEKKKKEKREKKEKKERKKREKKEKKIKIKKENHTKGKKIKKCCE